VGALPQEVLDAQGRLEQRRSQLGVGTGGLRPIVELHSSVERSEIPSAKSRPAPQIVRATEPEIDFSGALYDRIEPGQYKAIAGRARVYWDRRFMRHTCLIEFAVLNESGTAAIARIPLFLNLGTDRAKPRAGRCSLFWQVWVSANGGRQPARGDRMTAGIFKRRVAVVEVGDTKHAARPKLSGGKISYELIPAEQPYSIIGRVISWETEGVSNQQSTVKAGTG
jgi:hypothetical protein